MIIAIHILIHIKNKRKGNLIINFNSLEGKIIKIKPS
jgi:hypothetical protein